MCIQQGCCAFCLLFVFTLHSSIVKQGYTVNRISLAGSEFSSFPSCDPIINWLLVSHWHPAAIWELMVSPKSGKIKDQCPEARLLYLLI